VTAAPRATTGALADIHIHWMSELKRALGLPSLTFYGLGTILGAGIYSVLGAAAGTSGPGMWLGFAISAGVALLTALSYAELSTAFPQAGAEYVYLGKALPRWPAPAFATGILMASSGAATAATVSLAFAGYLGGLVALPTLVTAGLLLVAITGVAIVGIRESAGMAMAFTLIEAAGLVGVIALGVTSDGFGAALADIPGPGPLLAGASLVFFSYLGFENIVNLAEEAKAPERTLPRAILISLAISTALYVLVALAAVALLPAEELAASDAPLADAVAQRSPALAGGLRGIALFATANTALASLLSGSRLLFGMARGGDLPRPLAAVLPARKTPWLATLVVAGAAAGLLPLGEVAVVASVSSFASLLAFAGVNLALIVLRYRAPDLARPFRVPLAAGRLAILPAVGAASALALVSQLDRTAIVAGAGLVVVALLLYLAVGKRRRGA
jgi:APA family basic amino acid/polyamine antiporter